MVVSDTSPLSYLLLIGEEDVLQALYGEVWIPPAVEHELRDPEGPPSIHQWMEQPPPWLRVEAVPKRNRPETRSETQEKLRALDRGEREAIRLAAEQNASLLVIDERDGRRVAGDLGLSITGTLGVLDTAASEGLVDADSAADRLRETSFRSSSELYQWLVERHS